MNIRSKHPAVQLLDSVREHHLDRTGSCKFGPWFAYWFPLESGKTQVRINAPTRLAKEQALETVVALAEAGVISMVGEDCEGCKTEINCIVRHRAETPVRIEEDEEGYPRIVTMANPNHSGPFRTNPNQSEPTRTNPNPFPFGGDVA